MEEHKFHSHRCGRKINDREPVWLDIFVWDYISENKLFQKFKL